MDVSAYDPLSNINKKRKVFVPELQIESIFAFTKNYNVLVENEDLYLPVADRISFKLAADFLLENFKYLMEQHSKSAQGACN